MNCLDIYFYASTSAKPWNARKWPSIQIFRSALTFDVMFGLPPLQTCTAGLFMSASGARQVSSSNINIPKENMSTCNTDEKIV